MDNCQEHNTEARDAEAPEIQYCLATVSVFGFDDLTTEAIQVNVHVHVHVSFSVKVKVNFNVKPITTLLWQSILAICFLGSADTWPPFMVSSPLAVT